MRPGSAIVDVAADCCNIGQQDRVINAYGASYEKIWRVPSCAVANIPGAVARTSTIVFTNDLPCVESEDTGFHKAIRSSTAPVKATTTSRSHH